MKHLFWVGLCVFLYECTSTVQLKNEEQLIENCLKVFKNEDKCKELATSSADVLLTEEQKNEELRQNLSKEELNGLKLRKDIKDTLPGKNSVYVRDFLGIPDEIKRGGDREYWIYSRPISKYDPSSQPDREITVVFRRSFVEKVDHKKPFDK